MAAQVFAVRVFHHRFDDVAAVVGFCAGLFDHGRFDPMLVDLLHTAGDVLQNMHAHVLDKTLAVVIVVAAGNEKIVFTLLGHNIPQGF